MRDSLCKNFKVVGHRFTAVKRKKQRHFRFFRALKFESVQTFTSAKFV